jgi:hypothetical protein
MFIECRHILPTGYKCKSPALRGQFFCYFHNMSRRLQRGSKKHVKQSSFPSVEDSGGVKMALNKVFRDLDAGRIDPRRAGLFFYGLQLASKLALRPGGNPLDTVREVCEAEDGTGILGPEKSACEPPADCINCSRRGFCENFPLHKRKVEELEALLHAEQEAIESEAREQSKTKIEA